MKRLNIKAILRPWCWRYGHKLDFIRTDVRTSKYKGSKHPVFTVEFGCARCAKVLDIDDYHREEVLAALETRKMREDEYRRRKDEE